MKRSAIPPSASLSFAMALSRLTDGLAGLLATGRQRPVTRHFHAIGAVLQLADQGIVLVDDRPDGAFVIAAAAPLANLGQKSERASGGMLCPG